MPSILKSARILVVVLLAILGLTLSGCDRTANPDQGQRAPAAESILQAAKNGDKAKLLDLSSANMQDREPAAEVLIANARELQSKYEIEYEQHHGAPDNYIVTASDDQGATASFELSWHETKWRLVLGTAGQPQSPPATVSPPLE